MKTDSWKRPIEEKPIDPNFAKQLEIVFKPADATPEETQHWYETDLKWWGDRQLGFVAIATIVQLSALGFMLMSFFLINKVF